jgi:hypothetical protein
MSQKGRKPPQLGEPKQNEQGNMRDTLDPVARQTIETLAIAGYERDGRGALMVQLDDTAENGIRSAQYYPIHDLAQMGRGVPFGSAQPINEIIAAYNPEREFVAVVTDVTPTLPDPQMWFDIFPRET